MFSWFRKKKGLVDGSNMNNTPPEDFTAALTSLKATNENVTAALTSVTAALTSLKVTNDNISIELTAQRAQRETVEINSAKVAGIYFATNEKIWGKKRVNVMQNNAGVNAVSKIQERIKTLNPGFLQFCQMPPVEDVSSDEDILEVPNPTWRVQETRNTFFSDTMLAETSNVFLTSAASSMASYSHGNNSLAHSAPVSLVCSIFWDGYLEILTGKAGGTKSQRFHVLHGLWDNNVKDTRNFHEHKYQGLVNLPQNLLALPPGHDKVYDGQKGGNLIVVPIVDLDDKTRDPKDVYGIESQFDLLVVAKSQGVYNWIYNGDIPGSADANSYTLDEGVEEATDKDIKIATAFLETYAKAAAYLGLQNMKLAEQKTTATEGKLSDSIWATKALDRIIAHEKVREEGSQDSMASSVTQNSTKSRKTGLFKKNLDRAAQALQDVKENGVWVPEVLDSFDVKTHKVLKVKMSTYLQRCSLSPEHGPAWSLLGTKSTANYLVYAGQPFIPCCENRDPLTDTFPDDAPVPPVVIATMGKICLDQDLSDDESALGDTYKRTYEPECKDHFSQSGVMATTEAGSPFKTSSTAAVVSP